MKKLLTILLTIIAIQANAQFKFNSGKATANMDTLGTRNDTLFFINRVTGETSFAIIENGETITTREKVAAQIGDSITNKYGPEDTLLILSTKNDDLILDDKIKKLSDLQVTQKYYLDNNASDIGGYEELLIEPLTTTAVHETVNLNNNTVLFDSYATPSGLPNVDTIPAGLWSFHAHVNFSTITGNNYVHWDMYKRNLAGTETFLFRASSDDVVSTDTVEYTVNYIANAISMLNTDRLVLKVYAQTTGIAKTATLNYSGRYNFAYIQPPITFDIPESDPIYSGDSTQLKEDIRELLARTDTTQELVSRTIYVSIPNHPTRPGNDITGDGLTNTTAFATLYRAYQDVKLMNYDGVTITIQCDSGTYNIDQKTLGLINSKGFVGNKRPIIKGQLRTVATGITGSFDGSDFFKYNVSSPTLTVDAYKGYFGYNGASIICPIDSNSTNAIYTPAHSTFTSIVTHNTTIQSTYNQFITNTSYISNVFGFEIQDCKVAWTSGTKQVGNISFTRCYIDITLVSGSGFTITNLGCTFNYCYIIGNFNTATVANILCNSFIAIRNSVFTTNRTKTAAAGVMLGADIGGVAGGACVFNNVIFSNFSYGIVLRKALPINYVSTTNYIVKFKNCGTAVGLRLDATSDPIGTNVEYRFGSLYIENTDYITANRYGPINLYVNTLTGVPNIAYINPSSFSKAFVNNEIGQHISIPGSYPEYQQKQSVTLANNSTDSISIADLTYNRAIELKYTIQRGTDYRTGTCKILNTGTAYLFDPGDYIESSDIGVTLNGVYRSGGSNTLKLKWTTTNTGTACTFIYDAYRQNF